MVKSMTGWGRADFEIKGEVFAIEIKSLNHRFLDLHVRMPERFSPLENRLRDELKKRFSRGSFTVHVSHVSAEAPTLRLNQAMARAYMDAAEELRREFGVKGEVDVPLLLRLKDIFAIERKGPAAEEDWGPLASALSQASAQLEEWRIKEGAALKIDLLGRFLTLEKHLRSIEGRAPMALEAYRERLKGEMEKLLNGRVDESRLLLEAAVFAERSDIAEEIVRFKSHLDMFRKFMGFGEPCGKRMDFLCQETGREANTIGSKSSDTGITQAVIEIKGELEKIREQVQNIE